MESEVSYSRLKFPMDSDVTYAQLKFPVDSDITYAQVKFPRSVQEPGIGQKSLVRTTVTTPVKTPASSAACTMSQRALGLLSCGLLVALITLAVYSVRWSYQLQGTRVEVTQCSANAALMSASLQKALEHLDTTQQNLTHLLSAHRETTIENGNLFETLQSTNQSLQDLLRQRRQAEEQSEQIWEQLPPWNQFYCYKEKTPVLRCWSCQQGWTLQNQSCYYFSKDLKNWQNSKQMCAFDKSQLVSVNSLEEQSFIISRIEGGKNKYWMGYSDANHEGYWIWEDGSSSNLKFWKKGQPDNYRKEENCAATDKISEMTWRSLLSWNDVNCDHTYRYICEKDADQRLFTVKGTSQ